MSVIIIVPNILQRPLICMYKSKQQYEIRKTYDLHFTDEETKTQIS